MAGEQLIGKIEQLPKASCLWCDIRIFSMKELRIFRSCAQLHMRLFYILTLMTLISCQFKTDEKVTSSRLDLLDTIKTVKIYDADTLNIKLTNEEVEQIKFN